MQLNDNFKIVNDLKFFREKRQLFDPQLYNTMLKKLQFMQKRKTDVIFHYGSDKTSMFYIVQEGQVAILVPKQKNISQQQIVNEYNQTEFISSPKNNGSPKNFSTLELLIKQQAYAKFLGVRENIKDFEEDSLIDEYETNLHPFEINNWLKKIVKKRFPSMKIGNICQEGDSFGEIALIGGVKRTATVLCISDCKLILLTNKDFQQILSQYHQQVKHQKIQLLRNYYLFSSLSDQKLKGMIEYIIVEQFSMFSIIYNENSNPEYIYFIKQGEVELLKVLKSKQISIALLQVGCVFGYEEIQNQTFREYRAISKSSLCELYMLPASFIQQFEAQQQNHQIETKFYQQRLNRLLSHKIETNKQKITLSPKELKSKEYENFRNYAFATKRILTPKHKTLLSQQFVPFFEIPAIVEPLKYISNRSNNQSNSKQNSIDRNLDQNNNNSKFSNNIHKHLFSPKTTKRHLDIFMPFKKYNMKQQQINNSTIKF